MSTEPVGGEKHSFDATCTFAFSFLMLLLDFFFSLTYLLSALHMYGIHQITYQVDKNGQEKNVLNERP